MRSRLNIPGLAILLACSAPQCPGSPASSTDYTIEHASFDAGGGDSAGGPYQQEASMGGIAGIAAASPATAQQGFAGQIWQPVLLQISGPNSVPELSVSQLGAELVLDDGSLLRVDPKTVGWSIQSGPLAAISALGEVTAARVYQATPTSIRGVLGNFTATRDVTIADVFNDDFGLYAGDGIADGWQVAHFGLDNPDAAADADPSGTGQSNLFKYEAGLDPNDPWSRFSVNITYGPQSKWLTLRMGPCYQDRNYVVEYSHDLVDWHPAEVVVRPDRDGTTWTYFDSTKGPRKRFYRAVITRK